MFSSDDTFGRRDRRHLAVRAGTLDEALVAASAGDIGTQVGPGRARCRGSEKICREALVVDLYL